MTNMPSLAKAADLDHPRPLTPPLTSSEILGKGLSFCVPQLPHFLNGGNDNNQLIVIVLFELVI